MNSRFPRARYSAQVSKGQNNNEQTGNVKWNFGKFLIGKDGKAIARFKPRTMQESEDVVTTIEKALAA